MKTLKFSFDLIQSFILKNQSYFKHLVAKKLNIKDNKLLIQMDKTLIYLLRLDGDIPKFILGLSKTRKKYINLQLKDNLNNNLLSELESIFRYIQRKEKIYRIKH